MRRPDRSPSRFLAVTFAATLCPLLLAVPVGLFFSPTSGERPAADREAAWPLAATETSGLRDS